MAGKRIGNIGGLLLLGAALASGEGLTLSQALQEGLSNGPDAKILRNSVDSANQGIKSIKSVALPQVSLSASSGVGYQNSSTAELMKALVAVKVFPESAFPTDDPYYSYSTAVKVTQPLFTFGKVSTALRMAKTEDRVIKAGTSAQRQSIQQNVVDAWFTAVLAHAKLDVTEKAVARQAEVLKFLESNFAMGSGQKAQVLMARSRLIQTRQGIISARNGALASRKALNRLLERPIDDTAALDTAGLVEFEKGAIPSREELLREAYQDRHDLRQLQELRSLTEDATFIKKAAYYPTIGLQGAYGYSVTSQAASSAKNMFDWANRDWSVGVGLTWNIFDGWNSSGEEGQSRAAERTLAVNASNLRRAIDISVDSYLRDKDAADSGLAAATESVAAAREAYGLYQSDFKAGSGQFSDLLSAEDDLRSAELGWLSARLDRTKACIHLTLVAGKDLIALSEAL
jgi:HAE1 family hydrophobic/amphiphilic exporter-1